ncbi:2-phospho-L-lactate transferase [soil metagenome]
MSRTVTVLAGGVGAARFLRGLIAAIPPDEVTAIVNVGDDTTLHGLMISPDIDTVTYTLAETINPETGWGLAGETWQAIGQVRRYAESNGITETDAVGNDAAGWFALGDLDLGTHMYRTSRRLAGASLSQVTAEICRTWGLGLRVLPVSDDDVRTCVRTVDGRELSFQEYFVREHHEVEVAEVRFEGAETAAPAPGVLDAINDADVVCIAPSNPVVSIGPVLAVPGLREAAEAARERAVAVSPIVGGAALKGPADRLLRELGHEASVVGIARWYAPIAATLVIDEVDADLADAVRAEGVRCVVAPTIMTDRDAAAELARICLAAVDAT